MPSTSSIAAPSAAILFPLLAAIGLALLAWGVVCFSGWLMRNERIVWDAARRVRPLIERVPGFRGLERRFPGMLRLMRARFSAGEYLGLHLLAGAVACVVGMVLFLKVLLAVIGKNDLTDFDRDAARTLYRVATPWGVELWGAVSYLGTYPVMGTAVAIVGLMLWRRADRLYLPACSIALVGATVMNSYLKLLVRRARPFWETPLAAESTFSFPSGHSLGAVVGYGMIAYGIFLLSRRPAVWMPAAVGCFLVALAIGYARMYLGVHFFSDVVGGFALGGVWLALCVTGLAVAHRRGFLKQRTLKRNSRSVRRVA